MDTTRSLLLLCITTFLWLYRSTRNRTKYPPGPPGLPLIGNALQLSANKEHWKGLFPRWQRQYGPLTYLRAGLTPIIIIHTQKVASDLLEQRSAIYSGRPRLIVASEYICGGLFTVFMPYNNLYRRMRRSSQEALMNRRKSIVVTRPVHVKMAARLCSILIDRGKSDDSWVTEIQKTVIDSFTTALYGKSQSFDEVTQLFDSLVVAIACATAVGSHLVEFFPWMAFLPLKWKRDAQDLEKKSSRIFTDLYVAAKGSVDPSIAQNIAATQDQYTLSDKECGWMLANYFIAGSDSSIHTLRWFVLAMVLHPAAQKRCHAELDALVGCQRLPTFEDRDQLLYLRATLNELLRWRPVVIMGIPHASTEDDVYDGHFIPKGTTCIANIWAINHDKEVWGCDADEFRPERFIDGDCLIHEDGHASFGFGRRSCSGRYLAQDGLFMMAATLLWSFDILPPPNGLLPDPNEFIDTGIIQHSAPFDCQFAVRAPAVNEILKDTYEYT